MSFFINISGKSYKVPNSIIIGRGEPFTALNTNERVARSHLTLVYKKNHWYIKDHGSKHPVSIDGKFIRPDKFYKLKLEDRVEFAGELLMYSLKPLWGEFTEVKSIVEKSAIRYVNAYTWHIVLFIMTCTAFMQKGSLLEKTLIWLVVSLSLLIVGFFYQKIFKFIFPTPEAHRISYNADGFTVFYANGENMTFKIQEIQSWKLSGPLVYIQIHDVKHAFSIFAGKEKFLDYLNETLRLQKEGGDTRRKYFIAGCFALFALCVEKISTDILHGLLVLFMLVMLLFICFKSLDKYSLFPVTKSYTRKRQVTGYSFAILIALLLLSEEPQEVKLQKQAKFVKECRAHSVDSCRQIDFFFVAKNKLEIERGMMEFACNNSNVEEACDYLKSRKIASEK